MYSNRSAEGNVQDSFENVENNNLVTLNVLDQLGEIDEQGCAQFKGKKRVATPSVWKRNITKGKRAKGEETYVSLRGHVIQKKKNNRGRL